MVRIYEVSTELKDGTHYDSYRVAAKNLKEAIKKVTAKEIEHFNIGEEISEVKILASEDK